MVFFLYDESFFANLSLLAHMQGEQKRQSLGYLCQNNAHAGRTSINCYQTSSRFMKQGGVVILLTY
jgi:hypothetical protein